MDPYDRPRTETLQTDSVEMTETKQKDGSYTFDSTSVTTITTNVTKPDGTTLQDEQPDKRKYHAVGTRKTFDMGNDLAKVVSERNVQATVLSGTLFVDPVTKEKVSYREYKTKREITSYDDGEIYYVVKWLQDDKENEISLDEKYTYTTTRTATSTRTVERLVAPYSYPSYPQAKIEISDSDCMTNYLD